MNYRTDSALALAQAHQYTAQEQYSTLLRDIAEGKGYVRHDKISLTNRSIVLDIGKLGMPLLTCKLVPWRKAVAEMLWFISSSFDYSDLHNSGCTWWRPWLAKHAQCFGQDLAQANIGSVPVTSLELPYKKHYEAFRRIANSLSKGNFDCTRMVASLWPEEQFLSQALLPPCAYSYQLTVDSEGLSMQVHQRSADLLCGVPSNLAQYGFLLQLYSDIAGLPIAKLVFHYGDVHVYMAHLQTEGWQALTKDNYARLYEADCISVDSLVNRFSMSEDYKDLTCPTVKWADELLLSSASAEGVLLSKSHRNLGNLKFDVVQVHVS